MTHKNLHLLYAVLAYFQISATDIWLWMQEYDGLKVPLSLQTGAGRMNFKSGTSKREAYVLWLHLLNKKKTVGDVYTALKGKYPNRADDIDKIKAATEGAGMSKKELKALFSR